MKITSVCCHLSIVLRFEMRILLSFLFVLFYGLLFNNLSANEVCVMMIYRIYLIPLFGSAEEWGRGRKLMACVTPL